MSFLRPKYSLNGAKVEGDAITIPAGEFSGLTTRSYPYPRVGTRTPDGMFPYKGEDTRVAAESGDLIRLPTGYVRGGTLPITKLTANYTLNKSAVQGVMPSETYEMLTGKKTTEFELPPLPTKPAVMLPEPLATDWGSFMWGGIAGGIGALLLAYGVIPALLEAGAKRIREA